MMNKRKRAILVTFFLIFTVISFGQQIESDVDDISNKIDIIDSSQQYDVIILEPEEFLSKMVDHGPEFNGYYEHGRVKKMEKKIGTHIADIVTVFYFWNEILIYVSYKQRPYMEMKTSQGKKVKDYSNTYTKYEAKYYFNEGKRIKKKEIGKPLEDIVIENDFLDYVEKMKGVIDNKFKNQETYDQLYGKWVLVQDTDQMVAFDGAIKINYLKGRYVSRLKMKIDGDILTCWSPKKKGKEKYKIDKITATSLTLIDLSTDQLLFYDKIE